MFLFSNLNSDTQKGNVYCFYPFIFFLLYCFIQIIKNKNKFCYFVYIA